jgi:hypothetical protein
VPFDRSGCKHAGGLLAVAGRQQRATTVIDGDGVPSLYQWLNKCSNKHLPGVALPTHNDRPAASAPGRATPHQGGGR